MLIRFRAYCLFWVIALGILLVDQVTKAWVDSVLPFGTYFASYDPSVASPIVVIPGFFQIVHIGNEGAAWGLFSGYSFFLVLVGIGALASVYFFRKSLELKLPIMQACFGLIVGGVLGNLLDRMLYGHVVDFLDVHLPGIDFLGIPPYRWPAFNVADSAICCGVILYLFLSFFPPKGSEAASVDSSNESFSGTDQQPSQS